MTLNLLSSRWPGFHEGLKYLSEESCKRLLWVVDHDRKGFLKTPKWEKILMRLVYNLTANDIFGQFFCFLSAYLDALQLRQCRTG